MQRCRQPICRSTNNNPPITDDAGYCLDAETEYQFRQEQKPASLAILKCSLLISAYGFLGYIALGWLYNDADRYSSLLDLLFVGILFSLYARLIYHKLPYSQITITAKLAVIAALANLCAALFLTPDPRNYNQIWIGLIPVYFFIYGQLFMGIISTVIFCWLAMLTVIVGGHMIGVSTTTLLPSALILLLINLFGYGTRYQLEKHARRAFLAKRKAETTALSKSQFLQQLSHNLRQPLQALSCYASILENICPSDQGELPTVVGKLGFAIDELNLSFNNILNIVNLESGKQQPVISVVNINAMLIALADQFEPLAAKRHLKLKIQLRSNPPYTIRTDPIILKQILSNLLDNAIKYTNHGWICVSAVKISAQHLKLHIYDSGIGIKEINQQNIFKEFYRADHLQQSAAHGLGIGLAYVLKAVETLPDHCLSFCSRLDRGSDFQLYLPLAEAKAPLWHHNANIGDLSGQFVFIVDDDEDVLAALAQQLSSYGCLVQTATNKSTAFNQLIDNIRAPDLVITDYYLSHQETAEDIIFQANKLYGTLPTIILSAHNLSDKQTNQWPANVHFLLKPVSAHDLQAMICKAIASNPASNKPD
ncbi:response regulator [Methylomonas paludis]|uniref:histidine kinase n=1 Tax=Methylomonas paludis TaxID=1173101 RepID=A0A975MM28_9GAMM|nr:ATP-binding protein [Methylomonas paludis]QWF70065.1 response regulator [Methylomonas paludis]